MKVNPKRIHELNSGDKIEGDVIYWMSRDQRVHDNWALLYAQQIANQNNENLKVIFCLVPEFLDATLRQYDFMLKGLKKIEYELAKYKIQFEIIVGNPEFQITKYLKENSVSVLITDFDPLKTKRRWKEKISKEIKIPFYEVDAHNVVPIWEASPKQEYAAYTIRPKINKKLPEFLTDFPELKINNTEFVHITNNWDKIYSSLKINKNIEPIYWLNSGEDEAAKVLKDFLEFRLSNYAEDRNDPNKTALSNLSPYLHFGQISSQRVALSTQIFDNNSTAQESFLEELIVRKELADNFCYYNSDYDNFSGIPNWAKDTLTKHAADKRKFIYTLDEFENAKTHDDIWNASQIQMIETGKMHGYLRMYWAKKILEWTKTPDDAFKIAIYLNDKYEIDGRDPNGYCGIAWSIGGVHDRAWNEREIFGKVRYMSYNGIKKKFDIQKFIEKYE